MPATEDILGMLHEAVAQDLIDKIKSGEATAQELNAAIKFLKDNGIEALPTENSKLDKLMHTLPTFEDPLSEDDDMEGRYAN